MPTVLTVTLNPAYDIHYTVPGFSICQESYIEKTVISAGGKGVNIARAMQKNGVPCIAVITAGHDNSEAFRRALNKENVQFRLFDVPGSIRENITIHAPGLEDTRISQDDFSLSAPLCMQVAEELKRTADPNQIVAVAGRFPKGLSKSEILRFLSTLRDAGMRLVLDSNSLTLDDLMSLKPWLIKPNQHELSSLFRCEISNRQDALLAAQALRDKGITNVMVTLGGEGIAFAGEGGANFLVFAPSVEVFSTVGAGDSTIAGFLCGIQKQTEPDEIVRLACAFGTAACITEGTTPPLAQDIARLVEKVKVLAC